MRRRRLLLGTSGLAAGWLLPTGTAQAAEGWPPEVLRFVSGVQEREYLRLADVLRLDSAKAAYDRLTERDMSPDLKQRYKSIALPTAFEDPAMYAALSITFDVLSRDAAAADLRPLPHPYLGTLASGDVEANTTEEPVTRTPVVFFTQGLFSIFHDMAKLMAWAAPPLSERLLTDDRALAQIPGKYTMPPQASEWFANSLYGYAVRGTPIGMSTPIPEPEHNMGLAIRLVNHMERFVLAHELAHIQEGHLSQPQSKAMEFQADALATILVTRLADVRHGSWAIGYWACELALITLNFLYRTIGYFKHGDKKLSWASPTHPDPIARRAQIRGIWVQPQSPKDGVAAAREVCGMTEALLQRLWAISGDAFAEQYLRGDRTSPRWNKALANIQAAAPSD